jgi:alkanesulfonate monooxygenase SsuD/methylene tetrahydromethanopterin reductase-like flavin-dependent oxidoreductase (luciferase family)
MDLESRGIPAGFVASSEFIQAAEAQGNSLSIHPKSVFVPHPIQDRTDDEMKELARNAIEQVLQLVVEN